MCKYIDWSGLAIHPTAVLDQGCSIGQGTRIWHFCHISQEARIGKFCVLGQNVYVGPNVRIGDGVKIQNNVSVYEGVTLANNVFVGPSVVFTNVNTPRSEVNRKGSFDQTQVEEGASIGANATIICPVRIGRYALVGAGSVVTHDVPPFSLVYGNPAQQRGWACYCGRPIKDWCQTCPDCGRSLVHILNMISKGTANDPTV